MKSVIKIAIIDDHILFQSGLTSLFSEHDNLEVVLVADNGQDMITKLKALNKTNLPDVFIVDISMPIMDGIETVKWLNKNSPGAKIVMLTMIDKPEVVMELIKLGVKSYLTKDKSPSELIMAISLVHDNKYFFPDEITKIIVSSHQKHNESINDPKDIPNLTERELQLLRLSCTEMTYSEIANEMQISPRTVDAFRSSLFEKLNVKSRVGLVLVALKLKLITAIE